MLLLFFAVISIRYSLVVEYYGIFLSLSSAKSISSVTPVLLNTFSNLLYQKNQLIPCFDAFVDRTQVDHVVQHIPNLLVLLTLHI